MFYDIFITLCDSKNLSPSAAAKEIGIDKSNVSKWKSKGLTPRGEALNKIADYFNVTVDYLLDKWPGSDDFPSMLTTLRNDNNLSRSDIASIMGVLESDIDEYERGNMFPSVIAVDKLSAHFNLPRDYFFPSTENGQVVVKHFSQSTQKQKAPAQTEALSVEDRVEQILSGMESEQTLMLDGKPMSPEALEAFRNSLIVSVELARKLNRDKGHKKDENDRN